MLYYEERKAYKDSLPQIPLEERHTAGCVVLPSREVMLQHMPSGGIVAEVGAAFGEFSRKIITLSRPRRLHLVDMWESERYQSGLRAILTGFQSELATGLIEINRGHSLKILQQFADETFDWVYIDTVHAYKTTAAELRVSKKKVKKGGLIAGHDYSIGNVVRAVPYGVIEAVHEFCVQENWGFRYLALDTDGAFSFCLQALDDS